jgi:hypothetical protein
MKNWLEWQLTDYVLIYVVDGRTPGSQGDWHGFSMGDMGIGYSCDPCRDEGCLEETLATFMYPVSRGNLAIQ